MKRSSTPAASGERRRYRAFLSYSHGDARWAAWLHRKLEAYRVPPRLRQKPGAFGPIPERLYPIFRDREDLASSGALGARLENALSDSEALLVICSPGASRSRWVNAEVQNFIDDGRAERIYCLIVDGEPNSGDANECFPPALQVGPDVELIAADLRPGKDGRRLAVQKLLAGLLGVDLDSLRRRESQRQHRRMLLAVIASLSGMLLAIGLATTAWIARNDARRSQEQAQTLVVYMLGDLHRKLEKVGRLDLLGSLSDKAIHYLTGLHSRDLNDTTLKQLAQAMIQLGQVRVGQGRYSDALALFHSAYTRSSALVHRHPGNGDLLFDRGQAEYWIGYVYWQSGSLNKAETWLTRYRDTSRAVYTIDPTRIAWLHELAYGEHNLAVLEFDRGQLGKAADGFAIAHGILTKVLASSPHDPQLIFEVADEVSWQASVQEQLGQLRKAERGQASKTRTLAGIVKAHPSNPRWKLEWANAELMQAQTLGVLGKFKSSESLASDAIGRMRRLITHDPHNKDWSEIYLHALLRRAQARIGEGRTKEARSDLAQAVPLIRSLGKLQAHNHLVRRDIVEAYQLGIWLGLQHGDDAAAHDASKALMSIYAGEKDPQNSDAIGRYGLSEVLAGQADRASGLAARARAHFAEARRVLQPHAAHTRYWQVLDPWMRLALLTGHAGEAGRVRALLQAQGYVPAYPWPALVDRHARSASTQHPPSVPPDRVAPPAPARAQASKHPPTSAHLAQSPR